VSSTARKVDKRIWHLGFGHFRLPVDRLIEALAQSQLASQMSMFPATPENSNDSAMAHRDSVAAISTRRRLVLFICAGNTCRSAMAEAIARSEIAQQLNGRALTNDDLPMLFISAGISAKPGGPMTSEAMDALRTLGVDVRDHASHAVTQEMVTHADAIYCMARSHFDALVRMFPEARERIQCLDPEGDVADPLGQGLEKFIECATRIQTLIRKRFDELGLTAEPLAQA